MSEEIVLEEIKSDKVGIIPCNGEEICEGTLTRHASRKVLDKLRPGRTVTICLPLFIAGDKGERNFAKKFPTITVDGCDKCCSRLATERLSGKPSHFIIVSQVLQIQGIGVPQSRRTLTEKDQIAVDAVAEEIAKKVDEILKENQ